LYEAFGWEAPLFAHLSLLLRPDGNGKLSKRDGDRLGFPVFPLSGEFLDIKTQNLEKVTGYRESGYFPEAFINMLAFLGWNPGTTQEIFSLEELTEAFTLNRVAKAGAKFDAEKTKWFQQTYLRSTSDEKLAELLSKELTEKVDISKLKVICHLMKERATFIKDIPVEGAYLFSRPEVYDQQTIEKKWKDETTIVMTEWLEKLSSISSYEAATIESTFKSFLEEKQIGIGAVLPNFRLLLTGTGAGPSMFDISAFLGQEECIERMKIGLDKIITLKA
jgi:glutamyl-tRNA synthetase